MKTKKEQKKRRNIVSVVYWFADVIQYSWTIVALRVTGGPRWLPPVHAYLCKVCQWLAAGRLFSPGTTVSSTNKTDNHDITELLLNVALNTITNIRHIDVSIEWFQFSAFKYMFWSYIFHFNTPISGKRIESLRQEFFFIRGDKCKWMTKSWVMSTIMGEKYFLVNK